MKKSTTLLASLIVAGMVLTGCSEPETKVEEPKEETPAVQPSENAKAEEEALTTMKEMMKDVGEISFDQESKTYTIQPTDKALAMELEQIKSGEKSMEEWEVFRENYRTLSENMQNVVGEGKGYTIKIVHPEKPKEDVLVVTDGKITYDAMAEFE